MMKYVRFLVAFFLLWVNLCVVTVLIFACHAMALLVRPFSVPRQFCLNGVETILWWHAKVIALILNHVSRLRFVHSVHATWAQDQSYLMVLNHRSQADILVAMAFFYDKTPNMKFFMKQSLLYFPVLGQVTYLINCPFVKKMTLKQVRANPSLVAKQREKIKTQCRALVQQSVTLGIFSEGTRFTAQKHAMQSDKTLKHLLVPQPAGLALALEACSPQVRQLLDVTLVYGHGDVSLWRLLSGQISQVSVSADTHDLHGCQLVGDYTGDRKFRQHFTAWLKALWYKKDQWIDQVLQKALHH